MQQSMLGRCPVKEFGGGVCALAAQWGLSDLGGYAGEKTSFAGEMWKHR